MLSPRDSATRFGESHEGVTFYEGRVFHSRKHPVKNVFTYPLRYAVVDLDAPPPWFISSGQAVRFSKREEGRGKNEKRKKKR